MKKQTIIYGSIDKQIDKEFQKVEKEISKLHIKDIDKISILGSLKKLLF